MSKCVDAIPQEPEVVICDKVNGTCSFIFNKVVPFLGNITAIAIILSGLFIMRQIYRKKSIGEMNPIPYAFMFGNSIAWCIYGFYVKNCFVVVPNIFGFAMSLLYCTYSYPYLSHKMGLIVSGTLMSLSVIVLSSATIIFTSNPLFYEDGCIDIKRHLAGMTCLLILAVFYISPITSFWNVFKTKDASSFSIHLAITCFLNSIIWTTYGLAINDYYQIIPNSIGVFFALLQLTCRMIFGAKVSKEAGII